MTTLTFSLVVGVQYDLIHPLGTGRVLHCKVHSLGLKGSHLECVGNVVGFEVR